MVLNVCSTSWPGGKYGTSSDFSWLLASSNFPTVLMLVPAISELALEKVEPHYIKKNIADRVPVSELYILNWNSWLILTTFLREMNSCTMREMFSSIVSLIIHSELFQKVRVLYIIAFLRKQGVTSSPQGTCKSKSDPIKRKILKKK